MNDLPFIHERVNRLFDEVMAERGASSVWSPSVDIYETEGEFVVIAEVPGVRESDLTVTLQQNRLTIEGYRSLNRHPLENNSGRYHRLECSYGQFSRSFILPSSVDGASVRATLRDGLLTITIPKRGLQKRQIRID